MNLPVSSSRFFSPLRRILPLICAAAGIALLGGCSILPAPTADPTKYYVLTAPTPVAELATGQAGGDGLRIGLNAIELTSFLKGRSMVVRSGGNELAYQDYARWAEPLEIGIGRLLRGQLETTPRIARLFAYPFPFDGERDYDVTVHVLRCEGARDDGQARARFEAVIEISSTGAGARPVARKVFVAPEAAWNGQDYGALAASLSNAVIELSKVVIETLPAK